MERQEILEAAVMLQGRARKILHDEIGVILLDCGIEDLDDVGVIQTAGNIHLGAQQLEQAPVPLGRVLGLVVEANQLERMLGQVNRSRSPAADLTDQLVLADSFRCFFHTCFTPQSP